jgi:hypothetical protein
MVPEAMVKNISTWAGSGSRIHPIAPSPSHSKHVQNCKEDEPLL